MRSHRKQNAGTGSATAELNRKINALIMMLEEKGVLLPGEFEDSVMNLKIQLGDQVPRQQKNNSESSPAPAPGPAAKEPAKNADYIGPERRAKLAGQRFNGSDRRKRMKAPVGHITGMIRNSEGHDPVNGVQLILRRSQEGGTPIQFRSTKSDIQGRFVFLNLPLTREADSAQAYRYHLEARYRNRTLNGSTLIQLIPNQTVTHNLELSVAE